MGLLAGVMPAMGAMRLRITDALRRSLTCEWLSADARGDWRSTSARFPQRLSSSAVAIIGIAGVVVVFVSVLSIAAGFSAAMQGSGSPDRALVMRSGADSEMTSGLGGPEVDVIKQAPGIRRDGQAALASAELYVIIDLPKKSTPDAPANVPMRGIEPAGMPVREEVSIVEGRMFQFGTNEVIVGRGASGQFVQPERRRHDRLGPEPLAGRRRLRGRRRRRRDRDLVRRAHAAGRVSPRQHVSVGAGAARIAPTRSTRSATGSRRTRSSTSSIRRENEYYAAQSQALTRLIRTIGFGIAALMGIGAVFGAILTMYTAVATRAREIATLRALGFNTGSVLVSVLAESLVLGGDRRHRSAASPPTWRSTAIRRRR